MNGLTHHMFAINMKMISASFASDPFWEGIVQGDGQ
jgi:hypothetical protein